MGEEVKRHNQMLNEVDNKISKNLEHMENVNQKMKETLEEVGRSSDKLCVDIMCIVSGEMLFCIVSAPHLILLLSPISAAHGGFCCDILQVIENIYLMTKECRIDSTRDRC
jgi:hypothetical protein